MKIILLGALGVGLFYFSVAILVGVCEDISWVLKWWLIKIDKIPQEEIEEASEKFKEIIEEER